MKLGDAHKDWLRQFELCDPEVDLYAVRLRVGGPVGLYLKWTKHSAITLGNTIWFRDAERRSDPDLLVHELVHVGQYRRMGRLKFLWKYLTEQLRRRGYSKEHSLEAPAYARQAVARLVVREQGGPGSGPRTGGPAQV